MARYLILGYTNPLFVKPAPLITIIKRKKTICAHFPDCTINKLNIRLDEMEKLKKLDSFISSNGRKFIKKGQYSYLRQDGSIVTSSPHRMIRYMQEDLLSIDNNQIKDALIDLIDSERASLGVDTDASMQSNENTNSNLSKMEKLFHLSRSITNIKLFTTTRVKKNKEKAKRVIFQIINEGCVKTVYKKNLYSQDEFSVLELKRYEKKLYYSISQLSQIYKESLFSYTILTIDA